MTPAVCRWGAEAGGPQVLLQPGDADAGPELLKGSEGRAEGGMLEVVAAGSASFTCDRSRMVCLCETRLAVTMWGWEWPGLRKRGWVPGGGCACIWAWLNCRRGSVSCWNLRP